MFGSYGMWGFIVAVLVGETVKYLAILTGLVRHGLACVRQDVLSTAMFVGLTVGLSGMRYLLGFGLPFTV